MSVFVSIGMSVFVSIGMYVSIDVYVSIGVRHILSISISTIFIYVPCTAQLAATRCRTPCAWS